MIRYSESFVEVENVWTPILIIQSNQKIPIYDNGIIVNENPFYKIVYYTKGIFKTIEENGLYTCWYIVTSKEVSTNDTLRVTALEQQNADLAEALLQLQYEKETEKLGGNL